MRVDRVHVPALNVDGQRFVVTGLSGLRIGRLPLVRCRPPGYDNFRFVVSLGSRRTWIALTKTWQSSLLGSSRHEGCVLWVTGTLAARLITHRIRFVDTR
jgi:hypothetical protein